MFTFVQQLMQTPANCDSSVSFVTHLVLLRTWHIYERSVSLTVSTISDKTDQFENPCKSFWPFLVNHTKSIFSIKVFIIWGWTVTSFNDLKTTKMSKDFNLYHFIEGLVDLSLSSTNLFRSFHKPLHLILFPGKIFTKLTRKYLF